VKAKIQGSCVYLLCLWNGYALFSLVVKALILSMSVCSEG